MSPDGERVANASLRIDVDGASRIVATDSEGRFALDGLLPGEHPVAIRALGHAPVEVTLASARDVRITLA